MRRTESDNRTNIIIGPRLHRDLLRTDRLRDLAGIDRMEIYLSSAQHVKRARAWQKYGEKIAPV